MKLLCTQQDLARALNIVNRAVSTNTTMPVLQNILLKAEGKKLSFSATNLEFAIHYSFDADIKNEGSITIPAKLFSSYINLLSEKQIEVKVDDGWSLSLKTPHSRTKIKGINPEEFPLIPPIEKGEVFTIPANLLKEVVSQTAFCASTNITRPVLMGVLLTGEKENLKFAATDSYRLAEKTVILKEKLTSPLNCIIPAKTLLELGKILEDSEKELVTINISKNQILFSYNNTTITSRLIDGAFPDYQKIIPKELKTKVELNKAELISNLKQISLFVSDNHSVKITIMSDGNVNFSTDETQAGEGYIELTAKVVGENNKTALNVYYFIEVLSNISEENVVFEITDKLAPVVVKPLKKSDYVHIIMPLKV